MTYTVNIPVWFVSLFMWVSYICFFSLVALLISGAAAAIVRFLIYVFNNRKIFGCVIVWLTVKRLRDNAEKYTYSTMCRIANNLRRENPHLLQKIADVFRQETTPYSGCCLVAAHTGDGWVLEVQNLEGTCIGFLDWPASWPKTIKASELVRFGFHVA